MQIESQHDMQINWKVDWKRGPGFHLTRQSVEQNGVDLTRESI